MAKFPEPPAVEGLAAVSPDPRIVPAGTMLWRLYFRGGSHPSFWNVFRAYGPTRGRFDHHLPPPQVQDRQILYCAEHGPTCLAEVFQDTRGIDRLAGDPWLVGFVLSRDLDLLDLTGTWPTRAGASMALNSGPRPRAQRWARIIYEAYPRLQGIYYPSSMDGNHPALALTERALAAMPSTPVFHRPLLDPAFLTVLRHVARDFGYGLL
jgi:hypothetical protein